LKLRELLASDDRPLIGRELVLWNSSILSSVSLAAKHFAVPIKLGAASAWTRYGLLFRAAGDAPRMTRSATMTASDGRLEPLPPRPAVRGA
jgi:hypothetical protein